MSQLLSVLRNRNLGLLLSGQLVSGIGDWMYQIVVSVAIYDYSGGKSYYIGLLWIIRLVPGLFLGPVWGSIADRLGYRRTILLSDLSRLVIVLVLALFLTHSTWVAIFPLAFLISVFGGLFRPASVGLIPSLVRSSDENLSANAALMQSESIAGIVGGGVGGVLAGAGYLRLALLIDGATFLASLLTVWLIRPGAAQDEEDEGAEEGAESEEVGPGVLAGIRFLGRRPALIFAAMAMILPEVASGSLVVWVVPYGEKALHLGASGVGYLYAANTVGALAGGFLAAVIGSNFKLDRLLALAVGMFGIALFLFGTVQVAVVAFVISAVLGIGQTIEYTAYDTLLQQAVPEGAIGRVAGTMDGLLFGMMLLGSALSGVLASTVGLTVSIAGLAVLILAAAAAAWVRLQIATAGQPDPSLLARIPAFAAVPVEVREWAVRRMVRERVASGTVVIRQGDEGDRFYTIARGQMQVHIAQNGHSMTKDLGPGDFFGEIALLQNVPRTATVTALGPTTLWTMSREDFLELQGRASEFKESLWEAAAARLKESTDFRLALASRP